jgi:hypothetical protein
VERFMPPQKQPSELMPPPAKMPRRWQCFMAYFFFFKQFCLLCFIKWRSFIDKHNFDAPCMMMSFWHLSSGILWTTSIKFMLLYFVFSCFFQSLAATYIVHFHLHSLVKQELLTLPEHLNSPLVFSGVHVALSLVFCVIFCRPCLFVLLAIMLSVLRFTPSDCPRGIFILF